jgi:hypothetical protein
MSTERDPWLQQALRHAPDHDVAVPDAVRDTILNAARAAVRHAERAPTPWWQRWLAPLMQPARLGYSGAFMALLVVGLWGLDRWDQPAVAPAPAPVLTAPASPEPTRPAPSAAPAQAPQAAAVANQLALKESTEPQRMAKAAQAQAAALSQSRARQEAPPAPALAPAPRPAPSPEAPDARLAVAAAPVTSAAAAPAGALAAPRLNATLAPTMARKAAPSLPLSDTAAAPAAEPANPLAAMRGALHMADGARWQTAQAQGVHGDAQNLWLAGLQRASAGLWQPSALLPDDPPTVQWTGREGAQLWLQPDGQLWLAWRGQAHGAQLPPAEAAALQAQLAQWR